MPSGYPSGTFSSTSSLSLSSAPGSIVAAPSEYVWALNKGDDVAVRWSLLGSCGRRQVPVNALIKQAEPDFERNQENIKKYGRPRNGLDACRNNYVTALHIAANRGQERVARELLLRGANPDARCNRWSSTPLHVAKTPGLARLLLAFGASPDIEDNRGLTAAMALRKNPRRASVARTIEAGINPEMAEALRAEVQELMTARRAQPRKAVGLSEAQVMKVLKCASQRSLSASMAAGADCPICLLDICRDGDPTVLQCGHAFHASCIAQWLRRAATCPSCKACVIVSPESIQACSKTLQNKNVQRRRNSI